MAQGRRYSCSELPATRPLPAPVAPHAATTATARDRTAPLAEAVVKFIVVELHQFTRDFVVVVADVSLDVTTLATVPLSYGRGAATDAGQGLVQDVALSPTVDAAAATGAGTSLHQKGVGARILGGVLDEAGLGSLASGLFGVAGVGGGADGGDLGLEVGEGVGAAAGPVAQLAEDGGDAVRGQVAQRGDGGHVHGLAAGVELGAQQVGVHGADDEVLDGARVGQAQRRPQSAVFQSRARGPCQRQQRQLAQL